MTSSDWGGFAYRNGVRVPNRSNASIYADGCVSSIWGRTIDRSDDPIGGGHVVLGDGPTCFSLYKHYLEVSREAGVIYRSVEAKDWQWEYDEQVHQFFLDGCFVDHRVVIFKRSTLETCAVLHVWQPDGTHWHGFCGLSIGAGFSSYRDVKQTKLAVRAMRRTFKKQWNLWGPC